MTNLLDLPLDQFRGYLAEGNYPQARQDELMRAYRAKNSLSGLLDRYGEEGLEGKNVSTFFPVAGPGGMSIFDALKSGQLQTRFKDYASDALGGVIGALENPRAAYQGTLPQADYASAAMGTGGLAMGGGGVVAGRNIGATNANASKSAGLLAANASSRPNLPVDGTLALPEKLQQTVTFNGKPVADWQPSDWGQFGQQYGVPNLGPTDGDAWRKSLVPYVTTGGRTITVPGGDQPFTYYDLLHLKSQAINPNDIPPDLHKSIHNRMVAAMDGGKLTDERVANQMIFGMISPNQPLTANELALQRAMVKGPEDMKTLAGIAGYNYKQGVPDIKSRQETSRGITSQLGLQAEGRGGIGASGSANYTDISEMMQKLQDRPDFYRFDSNDNTMGGMSEAEKWGTFVTRVLNETRGLKAKTGSLATVWQQPGKAAISAIDRHMATLFRKDMFPSDKERRSWETALVKKFNKDQPKGEKVKSIDALLKAKGGRGVFVDNALAYVNKLPSAKTRSAKTGEFNERIPEAVRNTNWISDEPSEMQVIQGPYVRALEANQARANADGQSLFSSQWMLWDRIRKRLEPHEILYPGLEQLPRMSMPQMREVNKRHSEAGYKAAEGTVEPVANPSQLGYFANASAPVGLLAAQPSTEDELRQYLTQRGLLQ